MNKEIVVEKLISRDWEMLEELPQRLRPETFIHFNPNYSDEDIKSWEILAGWKIKNINVASNNDQQLVTYDEIYINLGPYRKMTVPLEDLIEDVTRHITAGHVNGILYQELISFNPSDLQQFTVDFEEEWAQKESREFAQTQKIIGQILMTDRPYYERLRHSYTGSNILKIAFDVYHLPENLEYSLSANLFAGEIDKSFESMKKAACLKRSNDRTYLSIEAHMDQATKGIVDSVDRERRIMARDRSPAYETIYEFGQNGNYTKTVKVPYWLNEETGGPKMKVGVMGKDDFILARHVYEQLLRHLRLIELIENVGNVSDRLTFLPQSFQSIFKELI